VYRRFGKRFLDLAMAASALVVLAPVIVVVALLVRTRLGSPVLFTQVRPGKNGRPFRMVKFRTMTDGRDSAGQLLPDDIRLTRFGRFLLGHMSLVGPRPLLMQYLPLYSEKQKRRHDVLPGLTGWAQVNGRNRTTWDERFAQDVWYVENLSLGIDLRVLVLTVLKVVRRDGVSAEGHATMPAFQGNAGEQRGAA
jgi:sugar transferase EpsL